jgi:hypothetical protein
VSSSATSGQLQTNDKGEVEVAVAAGHCRVDVELLGFRPAHYDLEIPTEAQCSVSFELDLARLRSPVASKIEVRSPDGHLT